MSGLKFDANNFPYIPLGELTIRLESEEPTDLVKERARTELRETPEVSAASIDELRALIKANEGLHVPNDDAYLLQLLRPCHFYAQSAYDKLLRYFKLKAKYEKGFEDVLPATVRHAFEQGVIRLLPRRDQHGVRMLVVDCGKTWKPSQCSLNDLFRGVQVGILGSMREPTTQICGGMVIFDFDGLSLNHVMQFTPSFAAMLLEWVQDVLFLRLKAVHIFNNSYVFNMLFAVFKPFIREKLRKRIIFHGKDKKSLTAHIDPSCLPPRYGGTMTAPECNGKDLADLFQHFHKDFELINEYSYIEKKKNQS